MGSDFDMASDFHELRFPLDIALGARGGPMRKTDIVTLASGAEQRNGRWAKSLRRYDAGLAIRTVDALHAVAAFFEERRGRLYGFRFRDRVDWKSCPPSATPAATDLAVGTGDGVTRSFQLAKTYGSSFAPYARTITKPVDGTVLVAVAGIPIALGSGVVCDATTGILTFSNPPAAAAAITAGFEFDVPVRFDSDTLEFDLSAFDAGQIPSVPLVEISM